MKDYKLFFNQLNDGDFYVIYKSLKDKSIDDFISYEKEVYEQMIFWATIEHEERSEKQFDKEMG